MKKVFSVIISCFLLIAMFSGCVNAKMQSEQPASSEAVSVAKSVPQKEKKDEELPASSIFLPNKLIGLGEMLKKAAQQDGFKLEVITALDGPQYVQNLEEELSNQENLVMYWVENEADIRYLEKNEHQLANLIQANQPPILKALADMSPKETRIKDKENVYGLPLGLNAQGTLVNIEAITALLGADNYVQVQTDLEKCTPAEWTEFVQILADYLHKPQDISVALGEHDYTLQRYRPEAARQFRAVFASQTGTPEQMVQNKLSAAFAQKYTIEKFLETGKEKRVIDMQEPVKAVFEMLELETLNMAGKDGRMARGEGFLGKEIINAKAAEELFANGSAIFLESTTKQGMELEKEYPKIKGKLAIIPTKLPENQEKSSLKNYEKIGVTTGGTLCVNEKVASKKPAEALLLWLYTSNEGLSFIEQELNLLAFSSLYSENSLQQQLGVLVNTGKIYEVPVAQRQISFAAQEIGKWVQIEMLYVDEWTNETREAAMIAAKSALGFSINLEKQEEVI